MQNFANNWWEPVLLAPGVTTLDLALPDGTYLPTLADSLTAATRWEIVQAVVVSGTATLTRAREGTTDQDWPDGSVMYLSVTAGFLHGLQQQLAELLTALNAQQLTLVAQQAAIGSLQLAMADVTARVTALESGALPEGALVDDANNPLVDQAGNYLI